MAVLAQFADYSRELDAHHDRRERIIKRSRDITAQSKKLIFHLHRVTQRNPAAILREADDKAADLLLLFNDLVDDLQGENFWRYHRQISPGIQEYIEAASFHHFLAAAYSIIAVDSIRQSLPIHVTDDDYLLGIADLTGEIMRYGINTVAMGGDPNEMIKKSTDLCNFVRSCKTEMEPLAPNVRTMYQKLNVTQGSIRKLENASYSLAVRGEEYKNFPDALKELVRRVNDQQDTREDEEYS